MVVQQGQRCKSMISFDLTHQLSLVAQPSTGTLHATLRSAQNLYSWENAIANVLARSLRLYLIIENRSSDDLFVNIRFVFSFVLSFFVSTVYYQYIIKWKHSASRPNICTRIFIKHNQITSQSHPCYINQ